MNGDPGYSIHEGVFDPLEMIAAIEAFCETELQRTKAGVRHVLNLPIVRMLANDHRLLEIAVSFLGPAVVPFRATLFDKSSSSNWLVTWHQDPALPMRHRIDDGEWGPWSEKAGVLYAHAPAWALERVIALRVHLDDSRPTNGPLRVLPDTHRRGVLSDDQIHQLARERTPIDCCAPMGSVVAMRPLTVHASSKSTDNYTRRVLHVEYAASLRVGPGVALAIA